MTNQDRIIRKLLEELEWPSDLETGTTYQRLQDDHDGIKEGVLSVRFTHDGDAWVYTDKHTGSTMRFRAPLGGTHSPRTHNALLILAIAMKLDEEDHPQQTNPTK